MIKVYNEHMGGVDRMDQNISKYRIAIRGKKWYACIVTYCIDVAINNAWQLHKICEGKDAMDLLTFRRKHCTLLSAALSKSFTLWQTRKTKEFGRRGPV